MSNSCIRFIDRTLSSATTLGQSDGNEGVLHFPQNCSITGASPWDCLMSYPEHSWGVGSLTPLQRCSRCNLQQQPNGLARFSVTFLVKSTWGYLEFWNRICIRSRISKAHIFMYIYIAEYRAIGLMSRVFGVVAIEKGAFGSPSTKIANSLI